MPNRKFHQQPATVIRMDSDLSSGPAGSSGEDDDRDDNDRGDDWHSYDESDDDDDDDDSRPHGGGSEATTTQFSQNSSRHEERAVERVIARETAHVLAGREMVLGVLLLTALTVTIATLIYLRQQEVSDYRQGFEEAANTLSTGVSLHLETLFSSFKSLSEMTTSFALSSGAAFPLVSVPNFDVHGSHVRSQTQVHALWSSPWIPNTVEDRQEWETFAQSAATLEIEVYPTIFDVSNRTLTSSPPNSGPWAPVWQMDPPSRPLTGIDTLVNNNLLVEAQIAATVAVVQAVQTAAMGPVISKDDLEFLRRGFDVPPEPLVLVVQPVFDSFPNDTIATTQPALGAYLSGLLPWSRLLLHKVNVGTPPLQVVVQNTCGQVETFLIQKDDNENEQQVVVHVGSGDMHQPQLQGVSYEMHLTQPYYATKDQLEAAQAAGACLYTLTVYPTSDFRDSYDSSEPVLYTVIVALIFLVLALTLYGYDWLVQRRNAKIIAAAARSNRIVSSLFPETIRDRLLADSDETNRQKHARWLTPKSGLQSFLQDGSQMDNKALLDDDIMYQTKPLADLFPNTTIMFADMVGFTAWSSVREPAQVFTLLETVYRAFDQIARRRRIFKVETVGDCYVAVAGLPEPRKDHAVAMAKFAYECLKKVQQLTKKMEVVLGPDTGDLTVRVGVHSGPVTAGVLRGDRSRFQLFGDTMNTAARMESTGVKDKIQMSQETADLLITAGKSHWIVAREEKIHAKGKGEMQTYWLDIHSRSDQGVPSSQDNESVVSSIKDLNESMAIMMQQEEPEMQNKVNRLLSDKTMRLIDWNVDVLLRLLKQIAARREAVNLSSSDHYTENGGSSHGPHSHSLNSNGFPPQYIGKLPTQTNRIVIDEVKEIIALPEFDAKAARRQRDPDEIEIPKEVIQQLHDYVTNIAIMYHENRFHNFEHASHVAMSVTKLLSRIVAPSELLEDYEDDKRRKRKLASSLHDHTYGITSDPLTQFACVFSALVHDVDHRGVPNTQLVKEDSKIADLYRNKSVAEQNSVDLAWNLLMDDGYDELRNIIYSTHWEFKRFRQLVVNSVMATDIMDKDLKTLRNARWDKAFKEGNADDRGRDAVNRKATIVIEHLIQASDVAHTMQHWHIYRKWNERFFEECYRAYKEGRAETDPSENWYKGEIGFFDFYIIPLAKKLKDCGVFGVSSDEYLNYAMKNRQEWEVRGAEVVSEMIEKVNKPQETAPTRGKRRGTLD